MPNSGVMRPKEPVRVLVRDLVRPTMWNFGLMLEWRWVDEAAGEWEACVNTGEEGTRWIAGDRLKRIGSPALAASAAP